MVHVWARGGGERAAEKKETPLNERSKVANVYVQITKATIAHMDTQTTNHTCRHTRKHASTNTPA